MSRLVKPAAGVVKATFVHFVWPNCGSEAFQLRSQFGFRGASRIWPTKLALARFLPTLHNAAEDRKQAVCGEQTRRLLIWPERLQGAQPIAECGYQRFTPVVPLRGRKLLQISVIVAAAPADFGETLGLKFGNSDIEVVQFFHTIGNRGVYARHSDRATKSSRFRGVIVTLRVGENQSLPDRQVSPYICRGPKLWFASIECETDLRIIGVDDFDWAGMPDPDLILTG